MTWSRFDDAARKHPKSVIAGNEAWGFWCAAIMYCNQYGTDGFIPDAALATEVLPCPIKPVKAKVLAMKLCEARVFPNGPGLFVRDDERGGFVVHGFLEWNPSKAAVDARRKTDRERKGKSKESKPDSERNPPGGTGGTPTESAGESGSVPPSRGHAGASQPSPAQPSPAEPGGRVCCPADLELTVAQRGTLVTGLVPEYAIDATTLKFRAKYTGDSDDRRTLADWRKGLAAAVAGDWNDPSRRPKKPAPEQTETGGGMQLPRGIRIGAEGL